MLSSYMFFLDARIVTGRSGSPLYGGPEVQHTMAKKTPTVNHKAQKHQLLPEKKTKNLFFPIGTKWAYGVFPSVWKALV